MAEQGMMKDLKKLGVGKRLAEYNCRKREEQKSEPKLNFDSVLWHWRNCSH